MSLVWLLDFTGLGQTIFYLVSPLALQGFSPNISKKLFYGACRIQLKSWHIKILLYNFYFTSKKNKQHFPILVNVCSVSASGTIPHYYIGFENAPNKSNKLALSTYEYKNHISLTNMSFITLFFLFLFPSILHVVVSNF